MRWLALCLLLGGCTFTEEAVGGLGATLTLLRTVVAPGEDVLAVVTGPDLGDTDVEVETEAADLDVVYTKETTANDIAVVVAARDAVPGVVTLTAAAQGFTAQAEASVALEVSND